MTLKSIVAALSNKEVIVVTTDPPMSEEVYARLGPLLRGIKLSVPELVDGNLVFTPFSMTVLQEFGHLARFNTCLERASEDPKAVENARFRFLQEIAAKTGLTLE